MEDVLSLNADNTHLYPGARLTVRDGEALPSQPAEVIVVFRDHSPAEALLTPIDDAYVLQVESYSTAAGIAIGAKSWRILIADDRTLTVKSRAESVLP